MQQQENSINPRVLKLLEFDIIKQKLANCARSEMGRSACLEICPNTDFQDVFASLETTTQAETIFRKIGQSPVDRFKDVREPLKKSGATLFLGMAELLAIAKALRATRLCKDQILKQETSGTINDIAQNLLTCRSVEEEIFRCIIAEDEIADNASTQLQTIRKKIASINAKVREKLNNMIHSSTMSKYLQEPIVTMRSNRYVLPVKQEHRQQVPGIIHDQSSSGVTIFVEPTAVVEFGNELRQLDVALSEEIQRILATLTSSVALYSQDMINSLEQMAQLDCFFAKAKLANEMFAICPKINDTGYIKIIAGRHPLIDRSVVVPVDIWLGDDFKTLIITGPNTGGKTVTLKTVGLFCVMAQCGLFVPAAQGVEISVFKGIFADIGDEQSIEQSLSTFSSHMKNIVNILNGANDQSLVLLDELGSGTDPVEGAALAMAILDELNVRKSTTLATTHYSELKAFAMTQKSMENASMEFNINTLSPTFRLFIGVPGKSNAFEISKRLGLDQYIIDKAQKNLDKKDIAFEDVISSAQAQKSIASQEREMAQQAREELYKLRELANVERKKIDEQREKIINAAKQEAKSIVAKTKESTEKIITQIKQAQKHTTSAQTSRDVQIVRDGIRNLDKNIIGKQDEKNILDLDQENIQDKIPNKSQIKIGQNVFVQTLGQNATINSLPDAKGEVNVQAGILKINVKIKDLRLTKQSANLSNESIRKIKINLVDVAREIDVRGENAEEAILEIERYLDDAALSSLKEISIIHGKGTGILRSAIHIALKTNAHVQSFRIGKYGEGEAGVTIVTLK